MPKAADITRQWYVVDAEGQVFGRVASQVANILRGKNKPIYTPNVDTGDYVIIINADKIVMTGKKLDQKIYYHHTGYVGGLKETKYRKLLAEKPEFAIRRAVVEKQMAKVDYSAVGRRKKAVARVRLVAGDGKVTINKRDIDNYFGLETLKMTVRQPLTLTGTTSFDVLVNVCGGGVSGQAGAIRHGISRALCKADPELRAALKKAGFLTRDPRMKERKKYGLKAARRAPQFSKR